MDQASLFILALFSFLKCPLEKVKIFQLAVQHALNSFTILCSSIEYLVYEEFGTFLYFNSDGFSFQFAGISFFLICDL